jgi:hypothetical protein
LEDSQQCKFYLRYNQIEVEKAKSKKVAAEEQTFEVINIAPKVSSTPSTCRKSAEGGGE